MSTRLVNNNIPTVLNMPFPWERLQKGKIEPDARGSASDTCNESSSCWSRPSCLAFLTRTSALNSTTYV